MHVAAPIRDGERIVGVLTVSLCIGLLFTGWIASSLQRLQAYAQAVARGERAVLPRMGRFSGNTEFSDLAQALERMRLKLEDKAYVESYVHTLTHELKSPLTAIRGAAELLQEPLPDAERERFAAHMQRQTERLQQLIDRLLGLAAVEQLRSLQARAPVDLAALTRERLQVLEPRLLRKRLCVYDELGTGTTVRGERFYSLPRSDTQERSSGLGLCLVREGSELHGGELQVGNVQARATPAERLAAGEVAVANGAPATGFEVRWRLPA